MASRLKILLILFSAFCLLPSAFSQVTTDTKHVQVAKQKLQVGTDNSKWVSSIVEVIDSNATHRQSPTAKAVYDWVDSLFATVSAGGGTVDTFYVNADTLCLLLTGDVEHCVTLPSGGPGATDLTFSGASSPVTLESSTGTDVTITAGGINALSATTGNLTITATEVDGSTTNEGVTGVSAGGANDALITSNTSGANGTTIAGGTGITVSESTSANGGTITITNSISGISGGGLARRFPYWITPTYLGFESSMYMDSTNSRIGFGVVSPSHQIDASGTIRAAGISPSFIATGGSNNAGVGYRFDGTGFAFVANSINSPSQPGFQLSQAANQGLFQAVNSNSGTSAYAIRGALSAANNTGHAIIAEANSLPASPYDIFVVRHHNNNSGGGNAFTTSAELNLKFGARLFIDASNSVNSDIGRIGMKLTDNSSTTGDGDIYFRSLQNASVVEIGRFVGASTGFSLGKTSNIAKLDIQGNGSTSSDKTFLATNAAGSTTAPAMQINGAQQTSFGTDTPAASAVVDITSTTQGFLPRMTTAQRDAISTPAAGLIIYNTSTNKHQGYDGTNWNDFY